MPFVAATRAIGRAGLFTFSVLRASKPGADFFRELVREIYKIGARTLPIITVGGAFVGLSVTLLGYRALDTYGAANQVSAMLGLRQEIGRNELRGRAAVRDHQDFRGTRGKVDRGARCIGGDELLRRGDPGAARTENLVDPRNRLSAVGKRRDCLGTVCLVDRRDPARERRDQHGRVGRAVAPRRCADHA